LLSAIVFGVGNYLFAVISSMGLDAAFITGPPGVIFLALVRMIESLVSKIRHGVYFDKGKSDLLLSEANKLNWNYILAVSVTALAPIISIVPITYGFEFAMLGHVNQGVFPILFNLSSFYNIAVFYFLDH
jgi:hypothetical protein